MSRPPVPGESPGRPAGDAPRPVLKLKLTLTPSKAPPKPVSDRAKPRPIVLRLPIAPAPSSPVAPRQRPALEEYSEEEDEDASDEEEYERSDSDSEGRQAGAFPHLGGFDGSPSRRTEDGDSPRRPANGTAGKGLPVLHMRGPRLPPRDSDAESISSFGTGTGTRQGYGGTEDGDSISMADSMDPALLAPVPGAPPAKKPNRVRKSKWSTRKSRPTDPSLRKPKVLHKRPLTAVLTKILAQIKRHDPYGFFWYPVDPAQVPDYARVIAKPMDLETMSKKIDSKAYADIFEFRSDVQLLLDNCRTFNPPNSTYHKAASKLEAYAIPLIERESNAVYTLAESIARFPEESLPVEPQPQQQPAELPAGREGRDRDRDRDREHQVAAELGKPVRKKYARRPKVRQFDAGFFGLDKDGSLAVKDDEAGWAKIPPATRWEHFLDERHRVCPEDYADVENVPGTTRSWLFMDAPTVGIKLPDGPATVPIYGSAANQAYIESMMAFAEGAGPVVAEYARRKAARLTGGATEVLRAAVDASAAMDAASSTEPGVRRPSIAPATTPIERTVRDELRNLRLTPEQNELARLIGENATPAFVRDLADVSIPEELLRRELGGRSLDQLLLDNVADMNLLVQLGRLGPLAAQGLSAGEAKKMAQVLPMLQTKVRARLAVLGTAAGMGAGV